MPTGADRLCRIALFAAGCGTAVAAGMPAPSPFQPPRCAVREVSRSPLTAGRDTELYVEPSVAVANAQGQVLLAGVSNFAFALRTDGRSGTVLTDSIIGAVVDAHGGARIVRSPVRGRLLAAVRAASRPDGGWDVLFGEVGDYAGPSRGDTIARLWHGVLRETRWEAVESIPLPPGGWLSADAASSPLRFLDTLAWALPFHTAGLVHVALFLHSAQGWSYDVVPTAVAAYAEPGYSARAGLLLAVVQPDLSLPRDANSLFLWTRSPGWHPAEKLAAGAMEAVHHPIVAQEAGRSVLAWTAVAPEAGRIEAHLRSEDLPGRFGPVLVLDAAVNPGGRIVHVTPGNAPDFWVLSHASGAGDREIRIVRVSGRSADVLLRIPDPYLTSFTSAPESDDELLISGGVQNAPGGIGTMLLRLRVTCAADAK